MSTPTGKLGREEEAVLGLVAGVHSPTLFDQAIRSFQTPGFSTRRFMEIATQQRVGPILYWRLIETQLSKLINRNVLGILRSLAIDNESHNRRLTVEAIHVARALINDGVNCAILKGPAIEAQVYPSMGLRIYGDIDVLVSRSDASHMRDVLLNMGYVQGGHDGRGGIKEASRSEILMHSMTTHEAINFVRKDGRSASLFRVDVNFEVFWKGVANHSELHSIPTDVLLNQIEIVSTDEGDLPTLKPEFQLVQLCAHLFSEALLFPHKESWGRDVNDLLLLRFVDIFYLVNERTIHWPTVTALMSNYEIQSAVVSVLQFVGKLFPLPETIPQEFIKGRPQTSLDFFLNGRGELTPWNMEFPFRLFHPELRLESALNETISAQGDWLERY